MNNIKNYKDPEPKNMNTNISLNVDIDLNLKDKIIDSLDIQIYDNFISEQESFNILCKIQHLKYEQRNKYSIRAYIDDKKFSSDILSKLCLLEEIIDKKGKKWILDSINSHWRIVRCDPGYFMSPHLDTIYIDKENKKVSKYTIMIYIGDHKGGNITFLNPNRTYNTPNARCIVFDQNLLHQAEIVEKNIKSFLRSEIMYRPEFEQDFDANELEYIGIN